MVKEKLMTWKKQLMILLPPIKHCKICFKEINITDMCRFFDSQINICEACQRKLSPKFIYFNIDGYRALALYEYSEFMKNLIYLYKGCFDYEMKDIFLNLFIKELKVRYKDYIVIPAPSYKNDDIRRGFNHVIEVFKNIGFKVLEIVEKTSHFKQAEHGAKRRKEIRKHIRLNSNISLQENKVLIVDDIYTTGATLRTIINLVEKLNPKEISVLVLAKTKTKTVNKI